jgi:hypothetical protein
MESERFAKNIKTFRLYYGGLLSPAALLISAQLAPTW